jgi:hypothetical protein
MRRDVHVRMRVVTPEAPTFELRSDRGVCNLPDDRTFASPPRLRSGDMRLLGVRYREGSQF